MTKKEVTYRELVKDLISKAKRDANFSVTKVMKEAGKVWQDVKKGTHSLYSAKVGKPSKTEKKAKKSKTSKKSKKTRKSKTAKKSRK